MPVLPEKWERYRKFLMFVLKYRNSQVFAQASDSVSDVINDEMKSEGSYRSPDELVEDLKAMGPTYVKLGQLLSTRPDLLPDEYLEALSVLQDDVEAIEFDQIKTIVEQETGARLSKAFKYFDPEPLATASIGQVHKAVLPSGREVAVKVQRPNVRKSFLDDLKTLSEMTDIAVKHSQTARSYSLDGLLQELRHILLQELDYSREAQNLEILGRNLRRFKNIVIPQPVYEYSSPVVLTMDFIPGQKVTEISNIQKLENNYEPLVDSLVKAYLQQIIVDGFAHADPHPGNLKLTPDNKIALFDLGMVAKFAHSMQEDLLKLLAAMSQANGDQIGNTLLGISTYERGTDTAPFKRKISRLVMDSQSSLASDLQTGRSLIQMNRIAAEEGIKLPVELNILGKTLLNLDQIVAVLAPKFDLQKALERHVQTMLQKRLKQELKPENLLTSLVETKRLGQHLPERINRITEKLANNELEIRVDAIDEKRFTDAFQKVANRITIGLIIAATIIAAAFMMRIPSRHNILGYPVLPMFFFLLAALTGLYLIYSIIRHDEHFKKQK